MARPTSRSTVFVGSSTPALGIAKEIRRALLDVAEVLVWDTAFDAGTWLLGGILSRAQLSDFAIFVIHEDDTANIKGTDYTTVRDNVLFEAGVFMGTLGPERTILLWPSARARLRLPADLEGLLRETYTPSESLQKKPDIRSAMNSIRRRIDSMGPALRNGYNEVAALKQALHERDVELSDGTCVGLLELIQTAARSRKRQWFSVTSVQNLVSALKKRCKREVVDTVYWWLILYGVITFNNIEDWTSGEWDYEDSMEYAEFTERGTVLLNELRDGKT